MNARTQALTHARACVCVCDIYRVWRLGTGHIARYKSLLSCRSTLSLIVLYELFLLLVTAASAALDQAS